jgi:hypothetical protein
MIKSLKIQNIYSKHISLRVNFQLVIILFESIKQLLLPFSTYWGCTVNMHIIIIMQLGLGLG